MFGYRSTPARVQLTTDRLVVRLAHERDAWRLAEYYSENRDFLKPWEPVRDASHCYPSGWQARLSVINDMHKQGSAYYFLLLDRMKTKCTAWLILATYCGDRFTPVIWAIRSVRNGRGRG